jgi:16S rRNA (uracil1498-N3)-methyltransferase
LGTSDAKLCFALFKPAKQSLAAVRSQAELGNEKPVLVPKLCLGTSVAKLCFALFKPAKQSLVAVRSQAELGNEKPVLVPKLCLGTSVAKLCFASFKPAKQSLVAVRSQAELGNEKPYTAGMADRFFTPQPLAPGEVALDGPEAHHLAAVRRFGPGDRVTLFNGDGREYPAEVVAVGKRSATLAVLAVVEADRELGFPLLVAAALPKGDRADFLVEKLTELGATRFVPLVTARSVVPKESAVEKFRRAVIEASKQCGRNVLMAVDAPVRWAKFVRSADLPAVKFVLHPGGGALPESAAGGAAVAVGPEGGFTAEEVSEAVTAGWRPASLGPRVLRVETAAVAAAAWFSLPQPRSGRKTAGQ